MGIFTKKKIDKKAAVKEKKKDEKDSSTSTGQGKTAEKKLSMKELYGGKIKASISEKKEKTVKQKDIKIKGSGNAYKILVKPLITEKAANLGSENKYVFEVNVSSNKIEIAKAINEVYGVKPISVNIVNVGGKKVRYGRHFGKRKDTKKAIITLAAGKTIKIYEGV